MKKSILFLILFCFVFNYFVEAAVIEGDLVSLDPINKSMRIKRGNEKGQEEHFDIFVPDGSIFLGTVPSIAALPAGTQVRVKVSVGEKPGTWVASEIKQMSEIAETNVKKPKVSPERMKEVLRAMRGDQNADKKKE